MLPTIDVSLTVHGPLMEKVTCSYAMSLDGKTAYMEMAAASGLTLVPEDKRNPMEATTYGVGEMIADAIERGCEKKEDVHHRNNHFVTLPHTVRHIMRQCVPEHEEKDRCIVSLQLQILDDRTCQPNRNNRHARTGSSL